MDKKYDNATRQRVDDDPCQFARDLHPLRLKKTTLTLMLDIFRSLLLYYFHCLLPLCWRTTARHLGLVSLPVEILIEAFAYLDFPGVLAVKLVCYILLYIYVTCSFLALCRHARRFTQ
jgi:hypothetical protein